MSNKLPKDEVILKCTKVYQKKINGEVGLLFKTEFDGTTMDCMLALASMVVELENNLPEEDRSKFRAVFLDFVNKIRCGQVIG